MTADPLGAVRATADRVIAHLEPLSFDRQLAGAAYFAGVVEPLYAGRSDAELTAFSVALHEGAKRWPTEHQRQERTDVAFEEAAHAVVAVVGGVAVHSVTIDPPPGFPVVGFVLPADPIPRDRVLGNMNPALTYAAIELAGPLAMRLAARWPSEANVKQHDANAERHLLRITPALSDAERRLWLDVARERARSTLSAHWPAVEQIAARLLAEPLLSGATLTHIVHHDTTAASTPPQPQEA